MCFYKQAVFQKACPIAFVIAFLQIFDPFTGESGTFITIRKALLLYAVINPAIPAMFRFPILTAQTARARLFMITVLIADHAIHSARREKIRCDPFRRHFHKRVPFHRFKDALFQYNTLRRRHKAGGAIQKRILFAMVPAAPAPRQISWRSP